MEVIFGLRLAPPVFRAKRVRQGLARNREERSLEDRGDESGLAEREVHATATSHSATLRSGMFF
jgi:hypothetical protein